MSPRITPLLSVVAVLLLGLAPSARGWDYEGHRAVNELALAALPPDFPAFVCTPEARERIAFLAGEPDRWRNLSDPILRHINSPDHFFDLEEIADAGLRPADLSEFRYTFTAQLAVGRAAQHLPAISADRNKDQTRQLVGFLPWTITECYEKLKSEFSYLKAFEQAGSPEEVANAQANIIHLMGVMGHYVADAAQPLHTTKHYNGWVGPNYQEYTTAKTIHAWIDGGFLNATGGIQSAKLAPRIKPAARLFWPHDSTDRDPVFLLVLSYIQAQQAQVEPLYRLEKRGAFDRSHAQSAEGRAFLENQLLTGANMLGSLWLTAWREAPADSYLLEQLNRRKGS